MRLKKPSRRQVEDVFGIATRVLSLLLTIAALLISHRSELVDAV